MINVTRKYAKSAAIVLVVALVIEVVLAGIGPEYPENVSALSSWKFILTHPTELAHVIIGVGVLAYTIFYAMRSPRKVLPICIVAGTFTAVGAGMGFVSSLNHLFLGIMTVGWLAALLFTIVEVIRVKKTVVR